MQKYVLITILLVVYLLVLTPSIALAKSKIDIDYSLLSLTDFLNQAYTPTYDCPVPELLSEIESRLSTPNLSEQQTLALSSMKTHSLICEGHTDDAKPILKQLLANPNADRGAQYYVSAMFQLGFIYDTEEDPTRCKYYELAKDASSGLYIDIQLSAKLGYISECLTDHMNERFFAIFELLDFITDVGDPAAIAHAHNRVGYLYSSAGRNNLAAQQYLKGFNIAKDVYTDSNLLTLLTNAITNFITSEQFDEARKALDKYIEINKNVDSQITKVREFLLLANYYLRTEDYSNLQKTLVEWEVLDAKIKNYFYKRMFAVYTARMCLYKNDKPCIAKFIDDESKTSANYQIYMKEDLSYHELIVSSHIALQNMEGVENSFKEYVEKVKINQKTRFASANSVNLLELHKEINQLESRLVDQQRVSSKLILLFSIVLLLSLLLLFYLINKKRLQQRIYDPQTGLLNDKEVHKKLNNLPAPNRDNTNALAVLNFENIVIPLVQIDSSEYKQCLLDIANTLKLVTRGDDIVGRLNGEKFVICIANIDEKIATVFFERVKKALVNEPIGKFSFTEQQIESCFSVFCSEEKFHNSKEILDNMLASLTVKANSL